MPLKKSDLASEAATLSPILTALHELFKMGNLTDYDFVGCFILVYAAFRRPNRWSCGRLEHVLGDSVAPYSTPSTRVSDLSSVINLLGQGHWDRLFKPTLDASEVTVLDIFRQIRLSGIKKNNDNMVNKAIVFWAGGKRPFQLLTRIPSPMTVLRMQASKSRVITLFYQEADLASYHEAMLTYMSGSQVAAKDAFEFLVHDMTHMEHFVDAHSHLEQVGLMRSILRLCNGYPKKFFAALFPEDCYVWLELEYLISDMNCFLPHLFKYLLAKVLGACLRRLLLLSEHPIGDTDIRIIERRLFAEGELYKRTPFVFYIKVVWAVCMAGLDISPGTPVFDAAMFFISKPIQRNTEDPEKSFIIMDDLILIEECERLKCIWRDLVPTCGKFILQFTELGHSSDSAIFIELDDTSAGETLRDFFHNVAIDTL